MTFVLIKPNLALFSAACHGGILQVTALEFFGLQWFSHVGFLTSVRIPTEPGKAAKNSDGSGPSGRRKIHTKLKWWYGGGRKESRRKEERKTDRRK